MKILLYLIFMAFSVAQNFSKIDQDILNETFNMNFKIADKKIAEQIKLNANYPKYYFLSAANHFQEFDNSKKSKRDSILNLILKDANKAIEIGEDLQETLEIRFWLAAAHGYLGRANGMQGSWYKAFSNGKKAKNMLEDIIEENPDYYDAYYGLGYFNYYADLYGPFIKTISWFFGMSGDREKGLEQLEIAAKKGTFAKSEALSELITLYKSFERNFEHLLKFSSSLLSSYPQNKNAYIGKFKALFGTYDYSNALITVQNDSNNYLDNWDKFNFYESISEHKNILSMADSILHQSNDYDSSVITYLKYKYLLANWTLENNNNKYLKDILDSPGYKKDELFSLIKSNVKASDIGMPLYIELNRALKFNNKKKQIDSLINLEGSISSPVLISYLNFSKCIYYFRNNDNKTAEAMFFKRLENLETRNFSAFEFLIKIYDKEKFPNARVEKFLNYVDDYDNDFIKQKAKDLKKKYNI